MFIEPSQYELFLIEFFPSLLRIPKSFGTRFFLSKFLSIPRFQLERRTTSPFCTATN